MNNINILFKDENGNEVYNELCKECPYTCKQCKVAKIVICKYIKEKKKKKGKKNG